MVSFVQNKLDFSGQHAVFCIVQQVDFSEIHVYQHITQLHFLKVYRCTFKLTSQEFHMSFIDKLAFKSIADTLFLHDMNIKRLDQHTHFGSGLKSVIILYHKLIAVAQHHHFIMYSFKNTGLYGTTKLCHIRHREYIQILRTNHHIHRCVFAESFVHTFKVTVTEMYQLIFHHDSVQDITFSDKVGHELVGGMVVDVLGAAHLGHDALVHNDDPVGKGHGLALVMGHINNGRPGHTVNILDHPAHTDL